MIKHEVIVKTIGKGFAEKLDEVVIDASQDLTFTRRDMVETLGCANFLAAYRLTKILKRLKIFTAGKLFRTDPVSLARSKGIGEASIFVAMCVLDSKGYDVAKWWGWKGTNTLKFSSFKHKAMRRAAKGGKQEV